MYVPSPLAAVAYGAVKIAGYAYAAHWFNRYGRPQASLFGFGLAKTLIGLVGGVLYVFLVADLLSASDLVIYLAAAPVRLAAWIIVIQLFYQVKASTHLLWALAGTAWSYALDLLMAGIYQLVPGMVMPWC
ncbi:MAG: hypothetical protein KDI71_09445 [Xanthomonadales bacterium]|nr:hypothetical protein [Xanthomonadales bacterium]